MYIDTLHRHLRYCIPEVRHQLRTRVRPRISTHSHQPDKEKTPVVDSKVPVGTYVKSTAMLYSHRTCG